MNVLVLNADHQRHQFVPLNQAVKMLLREVAVIHESEGTFGHLPRPKVIRLVKYIYVKIRDRAGAPICSRPKVLRLYNYVCCYCGGEATTQDHVIPKSRGGLTEWKNLVGSCRPCNESKGDRLPEELNLDMLYRPFIPTYRDIIR